MNTSANRSWNRPCLRTMNTIVSPIRFNALRKSVNTRTTIVRAAADRTIPDDENQDPPTQMEDRVKELSAQLSAAQTALKEQEERQNALAPYRVAAPRRGIIGNSKYATNLRKQVLKATRDPRRAPVLIFGEPGLQKLNIAALIHFGSRLCKAPLVRVDCDRLDEDASDLFGRGAKRGLLAWLPPEGTLILNNVHKAPIGVLPLLQREVATSSIAASIDETDMEEFIDLGIGSNSMMNNNNKSGDPATAAQDAGKKKKARLPRVRHPRIIMTTEARVPAFEMYATTIRVPPLRVRPEDVDDLTKYFLKSLIRQKGCANISLTPEALRRLEAGQYPNNIAELEATIDRAFAQTTKKALNDNGTVSLNIPKVMGEEVFWFASMGHREGLRLDLLKSLPLLRKFMRSNWWPEKINFDFTVYAFALVVAILFIGPQDRSHNFALNAFWCYWWPLSFIAYPFLGRIWCSVCPFMIYGELVQRWRLATGAKLMKWPREWLDTYGAWFLFGLFALILVWEEVWDLPQTAALSSWLLLLITAGAMIGSYFFERRVWCRYLCPIGGMNGLFAKLSMTELRARQGVCSASCDTYTCYKGGPAVPPEGQESVGCPVYSHPAQLNDNRNCVLCAECLKACPHRSIQVNLRVPGVDLWTTHTPMAAEAALQHMLFGAIFLHNLPAILTELGIDPSTITHDKIPHIIASFAFLALPGGLAWGADAGWRYVSALTRPQNAPKTSFSSSPSFSLATEDPSQARAMSILSNASSSYAAVQAGALIIPPQKSFLELSYGYLPLVWGGTLAYYLESLMREAGLILPVAAQTIHADGRWLPVIQAHPAVVSFLQGGVLLFSASASLIVTRKIAGQPWKVIAMQCAMIGLFTAELWHLIVR